MKTVFALIAAVTLIPAALVQAKEDDVLLHQIPQLIKEGKVKPLEELTQIALKLHPGSTITETQLEHRFKGYIYEVEGRDPNNVKWDVDILAATGEVLNNK
ncbi:PepSY domain-containing protein [Pseudomonas sp. C2B4]|uniref:PepSY domain-containing protein n=1 Tax=Pseudomonas sp. C2B4 TaxID=2735270 RepID=UPI001586E424|nr:PepSY domain-containing protein [Pseudomonas sp. C2B4]NUU35042.1 peptidase M4 [Pseudomonas sp. C2B4]